MEPEELVRSLRQEAGLSLRDLAAAAGMATSTVHRVEQGTMAPTTTTLDRLAGPLGVRLRLVAAVDHATSLTGFARVVRAGVEGDDARHLVRKAAELVHRFERADVQSRRGMTAARPPSTGDVRWDAFVGGLAEWLAVRAGLITPAWALEADRYLAEAWWVTPMRALRAWEYAGTPMSLKAHGVYLHRDSLTNV